MVISSDGWLVGAQRTPSPNKDLRPVNTAISLVVIHAISLPSGEFGTGNVERLFTNSIDLNHHPSFESLRDLKVSSHLFISREGEITQFVSFHERAWHAGESSFRNQRECNDYSIGIELEGSEDVSYTDSQYHTLGRVTQALMSIFPHIAQSNIVGHSEIAPGRKWDPGPMFDWNRLLSLLTKHSQTSSKKSSDSSQFQRN